jgi:hypothetical protein
MERAKSLHLAVIYIITMLNVVFEFTTGGLYLNTLLQLSDREQLLPGRYFLLITVLLAASGPVIGCALHLIFKFFEKIGCFYRDRRSRDRKRRVEEIDMEDGESDEPDYYDKRGNPVWEKKRGHKEAYVSHREVSSRSSSVDVDLQANWRKSACRFYWRAVFFFSHCLLCFAAFGYIVTRWRDAASTCAQDTTKLQKAGHGDVNLCGPATGMVASGVLYL